MIQSITIKNTLDDTDNGLTIELGAPEKTGLWVKSIKGIGPEKADINTTDFASSDGGIFNSARSQIRNITMTIGIVDYTDDGGIYRSVEYVRHSTYKWFAKKRPVTVTVTTDRTVLTAYGYVESVTPDIFNKQETMAISIVCPDPNWYNSGGSDTTHFSGSNEVFEFPIVFKETTDRYFQQEKDYYEYNLETGQYYLTADQTMKSWKTYYEEDTEESGYQNLIIDDEYFETRSAVFVSGVIYYERDELNDTYVQTEDIEYYPTKTYYTFDGQSTYTVATYMNFTPSRYYYEYDQSTTSYYTTLDANFILSKTYYEYQNNTILSTIEQEALKDIEYTGEVDIGVEFVINITGDVTGLKLYKYYDRYTTGIIEIDDNAINFITGRQLSSGDEIRICTISGKKSATLTRNGETKNILNALGKNPDWFQITNGLNTFGYTTNAGGEGFVILDINYVRAYEGI